MIENAMEQDATEFHCPLFVRCLLERKKWKSASDYIKVILMNSLSGKVAGVQDDPVLSWKEVLCAGTGLQPTELSAKETS